jgi:hypothetical protein
MLFMGFSWFVVDDSTLTESAFQVMEPRERISGEHVEVVARPLSTVGASTDRRMNPQRLGGIGVGRLSGL